MAKVVASKQVPKLPDKFIKYSIIKPSKRIGTIELFEFGKRNNNKIQLRVLSRERRRIKSSHFTPCSFIRYKHTPYNSKTSDIIAIEAIEAQRINGYKFSLNGTFRWVDIKSRTITSASQINTIEYIDYNSSTEITTTDYKNDTSGAIFDFYEIFAEAIDEGGIESDTEESGEFNEDSVTDLIDKINYEDEPIINPSGHIKSMIKRWYGCGKSEFENWRICENENRNSKSTNKTKQLYGRRCFLHDNDGLLNSNPLNPQYYCKMKKISIN